MTSAYPLHWPDPEEEDEVKLARAAQPAYRKERPPMTAAPEPLYRARTPTPQEK